MCPLCFAETFLASMFVLLIGQPRIQRSRRNFAFEVRFIVVASVTRARDEVPRIFQDSLRYESAADNMLHGPRHVRFKFGPAVHTGAIIKASRRIMVLVAHHLTESGLHLWAITFKDWKTSRKAYMEP